MKLFLFGLLALSATAFAAEEECTDEVLQEAHEKAGTWEAYNESLDLCASDVGVTSDTLYSLDYKFNETQIVSFMSSPNCIATYSLDAQALGGLSEPCMVNEFGALFDSRDIASRNWYEFIGNLTVNAEAN